MTNVIVRWTGAGWYAPLQEGPGWDVVSWESVCDADSDREEAGECPRCHGAGVIEELERQGPFLVPALNPCPVCVRREDPPLPF